MKELTLAQIAEACGGTLIGGNEAKEYTVTGVEIDSRRVKAGDLFVAIPGEKVDGHKFIPDVLKKGAYALSQQSLDVDGAYILVEDTVVENDYFHLTIPEELVGKLGYAMVIRGGGYGVTFFADDMRDYGGILYGLSYDGERAEAYHLAEPANTQCRAEDLERYLEYQKLLKDAIQNSYVPNNSNFTGTI